MPTLNWIGKEAVVQHHKEVPFRLLKCNEELSVGPANSENMLIEGDNLEALKALLPYYKGKAKCIYIDPPYNTGNENWVYNDNVNSPQIRDWLGKVVGRDDLSRHDKWLCMMYPRLVLLREMLSEDGAIFVSIDENEIFHLGLVCDEIFSSNRVGVFVWKSRSGRGGTVKNLAIQHEYVLAYAKNIDKVLLKPKTSVKMGGKYSDEKGSYDRELLRQWGQGDRKEDRPSMFFPIYTPDGKEVLPIKPDGTEGRWRFGKKRIQKMLDNNDIDFVEKDGLITAYRKIRAGKVSKTSYGTLLLESGTAAKGTLEIKQIFGKKVFNTPKPTSLVKHLIDLVTYNSKDAIILDSFAGSGTTGQAVMQLNQEDGGNRSFILVEMKSEICQKVTAERLKRVINDYNQNKKQLEIEYGLDGEFRYFEMGETIFDVNGQIRENITFEELARHVFFTEMNMPLPEIAVDGSPLLGVHDDIAVYLLYKNGRNVLTRNVLENLPPYNGAKVIYGTSCRLSQTRLREHNITFRQIPYDIKVN